MNRYILGFLISVGLIILILILMFSGHSAPTVNNNKKSLTSYANTSAVTEMTINGPVTAAQNHYSVQIIVGENSATINLIQGYDNNVISSKTYPNSLNGYQQFLAALDHAGYSLGNNSAALSNDLGYCSTGNTYVFELVQNGNNLERYWATNCSTVKTYAGDLSLTIGLFEAQIPDYSTLEQPSGLY